MYSDVIAAHARSGSVSRPVIAALGALRIQGGNASMHDAGNQYMHGAVCLAVRSDILINVRTRYARQGVPEDRPELNWP